MLTISGLTKSFGGRVLFEDASLQVNTGDRIGIVGPNGAGKSTLFALILRREEPDSGTIAFQRGATVGYLPQESAPVGDETILELATAISSAIEQVQQQMRASADAAGALVEEARQAFEALGGFELQARAKRILSGLGFRQTDFDRRAGEFSGGWIMRAHLARLLVQEPDLLMLDEPTNHLDLEALLWLQNYLKTYPGSILMISHDREFLNALVHWIIELRQESFFRYRGNYDEYLVQRAAKEEQLAAAYKNQQREIARLMTFVDRFRAKNTKATQAQSKLKQIERMEKIEAPDSTEATVSFRFPQPQRSGLKPIRLAGVGHAYGDNVVYDHLDFEVERGQKLVLVGPNGAGKSTLLKLLAGVLPVQKGERILGHNAKPGYYSQHRIEVLHPERTVLEEALDTPQRVTEQFVRTVLGAFLFRGDDVFKRVAVLSGGEKSRLALVKLLLDPPNLLLMDEPTTHLDMASIDALIEALRQYDGTLVFISHDVYFIRQIANRVLHVRGGGVRLYPGDYQYYLDKTQSAERAGLTAGGISDHVQPAEPRNGSRDRDRERKRLEAEARQERYRRRRDQESIVKSIEQKISTLETRQSELVATLESPETYQDAALALRVNRELSDVIEQLASLNEQWEQAAQRLAEIENAA